MLKTGNARKGFKSDKEQLILYFYKVFYRNSYKEFIEYVSICSLLFFFDFKPRLQFEREILGLSRSFFREEWGMMVMGSRYWVGISLSGQMGIS
jgi:hypothetical protein